MELRAPAKLNLALEVLGRRPDGYHEIDSLFAEIDLHDTVVVARAPAISLTVEGDDAVPADAANLAWRAAESLGVGARIRLVKRIPAGAGLGGGSSDAAAVLAGLDRLYALGLGPEGLFERARALGADVPYFLRGGLARCRGIGDRVEPREAPPPRPFHLVVPEVPVATEAVYRSLPAGLTGNPEIVTVLEQSYRRGAEGLVPYSNRLQAVAERLEPRLRAVREAVEKEYAVTLTLTGSGSAYYCESTKRLPAHETRVTAGGVPVRLLRVSTV